MLSMRHVLSCPLWSCLFLSCNPETRPLTLVRHSVLLCLVSSGSVQSCLETRSLHTSSCPLLSCLILPYIVLSCLVLSCLVEHRLFPTSEGGMSVASFLHSSFLQAISAVMLWPVHVEKVPQAPEHLCPAKLQTRCDICCACQSICPFIPTDSGVSRTVDPQKSLQPKTAWLCASRCSPFQTPPFAGDH